MKKIITLAVAMFAIVCFANAQTSWQDYRYVTEGLKDDFLKGKGVKSGYYLYNIGTENWVSTGNIKRNAQIFYFKKGDVNKAFIIKIWDSENNFNYYCIPTADADTQIWNMAFKAISDAGKEWHLVFAWALAKVVSQKL